MPSTNGRTGSPEARQHAPTASTAAAGVAYDAGSIRGTLSSSSPGEPPRRHQRRLSMIGVALLISHVQDAGGVAASGGALPASLSALPRCSSCRSLAFSCARSRRARSSASRRRCSGAGGDDRGDALGDITPFGLAASEPGQAFYIGRHLNRRRAFAALAAENFFYSVSVAVP